MMYTLQENETVIICDNDNKIVNELDLNKENDLSQWIELKKELTYVYDVLNGSLYCDKNSFDFDVFLYELLEYFELYENDLNKDQITKLKEYYNNNLVPIWFLKDEAFNSDYCYPDLTQIKEILGGLIDIED